MTQCAGSRLAGLLSYGVLAWLAALLLYSPRAWPVSPDVTLQQLNHRAFTSAEGVPAPIYALAQTQDGILWFAGPTGLTRFDGARFVPYPSSYDPPLPASDISALLASGDGGLWIGFRMGGVSLLRAGQLTRYGQHEGMPAGTVKAMALDRQAALWVATTGGLFRISCGHVDRVAGDRIADATGVFVDRSGALWVATGRGLLARPAGATRFQDMSTELTGHRFHSVGQGFAESADGHLWAAYPDHLTRLDPSSERAPHNRSFSVENANNSLLIDQGGNVWIAARQDIKRWPAAAFQADVDSSAARAHVETLGSLSGTPQVFLEDREHNIWVATTGGLDRFSRTNVVRVGPECLNEGYALAADSAGTLWAACYDADSLRSSLLQIRDGQIVSQRDTAGFTAAYRDPSGDVWFGGPLVLWHPRPLSDETIPLPEALRGFDVQALASDRSGALWVSVIRKGVYRYSQGQWTAYGGLDAMPRGVALLETVDPEGTIWFGYTDNHIARLSATGAVQVFDSGNGLNVGNVTAIHSALGRVWVGGDRGFARFDGSRFVSVRSSVDALKGISGIVGTPDGAVWLNEAVGIAHIARDELDRAIRDPGYAVHCEITDHLDGVPAPPVSLRPIPTAVATADGRIWFSLLGGLIWIDSLHPVRNTLVPPVTIWSLSSAGKAYPNRGITVALPVMTTRVQIDYSAGSLTTPERVRFRYKLEGSDRDWQEAGISRQALYTNLGPGHYTFRVVASNNDGVWNNAGASLDFTIRPAFHQTSWFYVLCGLLCLALLVVLYQLRMRQMAAQIRARLQVRLAERERIARELHDTLLQGVQGLIWRFQAATNHIPRGEKARELLESALKRADGLLIESRDRVKELRAPAGATLELRDALATEGEHLALAGPAEFVSRSEGVPRELHPIVREEVLLIAREAMINAFRHSGARHIEVVVTYTTAALRVKVRDDGLGGIPDGPDKPEDSGHFGLLGMRERAQRIRAELSIFSQTATGAEIDLTVPADLAYLKDERSLRFSVWQRLTASHTPDSDSSI